MFDAQSQQVLVTGAAGSIRPNLLKRICEVGYKVRTLSIDESETDFIPDDVEVQVGNVTDSATVKTVVEGISVVFHLAALLHITN